MKPCIFEVRRVVLSIFMIGMCAFINHAQNNNSISGMVFDSQGRQPVSNLHVELTNEIGMTVSRARVESSGRFIFNGLSSGTFRVRVLTFGTGYQEEIQEASLLSMPRRGGRLSSDRVYLEFYLKPDPKKVTSGITGVTGTVFVQEIPEAARRHYKNGIEQLENKKDEGLTSLKQAIEIFPTYFDALDRLGNEYVRRSRFAEAAPLLIKAIDVNQRSFSSFYALGIAGYHLKNLKAATEALRAATTLNPQSINAQIWYGIVLRGGGDYEKSEKALLAAKAIAEKSAPLAEVHWQLALLYEKRARYAQAADELEKYLKIEARAPNAEQIKKLIAELRAKAK